LPSPKSSEEDVCEDGDDHNKEENVKTLEVVGTGGDGVGNVNTSDKKRRLTPYFPESVQNRLLEELKKENRFEALTEEEEEDDDSAAEKEWSISFMKKLDSITQHPATSSSIAPATVQVTDFSETNESDMLQKIEQQNQIHVAPTSNHQVCPSNEFPTEADFMSMVNQQTNQYAPNGHELQLMSILGHNQLAPGILALYNSIQSDVMKLLSSTNIALLSSQSVSPSSNSGNPSPIAQSPASPSNQLPVSPLYQSPVPPMSPLAQPPMSPLAQSPIQTMPSYNDNQQQFQQPVRMTSHSPQTPPPVAITQNEGSEYKLPKLDPSSSVCLTGESPKQQDRSTKPSPKTSHYITTPELPAVKSPLASRRSLSKPSPMASSSQCKVINGKTTPSAVPLPSVGNTRSVIVVQNKVVESVASNGAAESQQKLEEKDSLTNEEVEVVLRSPADFEQSKILIHALNEIAKEEELEETNFREKKKSVAETDTKRIVSIRSRQKSYSNNDRQTASLDFKSSTRSPRKERTASTVSIANKSFHDNDTPNYAKPLKRIRTDRSFTTEGNNKTTSSTPSHNNKPSEHKNEKNSPSVFERLSKHRKSSVNTTAAIEDPPSKLSSPRQQTQKPNISISKNKTSTTSNSKQIVPTSRHRTVSITKPEIQQVKSIESKKKQSSTTKSNSTKEISSSSSSSANRVSKRDLASRSRQRSNERKSSSQIEAKNKSSSIKKIKKRKSSKISTIRSSNSVNSSSITSSKVEEPSKKSTTKLTMKDVSDKRTTSQNQEPSTTAAIRSKAPNGSSSNKDKPTNAQQQEISDDKIKNNSSNVEPPPKKDDTTLETDQAEELKVELLVKQTLEDIGLQLSCRELHDIPENEPLPSQKTVSQSVERLTRSQRNSGGSSGVVVQGSNISKVSLTFDDVAQFGRSDISARKSGFETIPSKHSRSMRPVPESPGRQQQQQPSTSAIYNQSVGNVKPTVSNVKFHPSSANSNTKQMMVSQSARSVMSNHSARSGKSNRSVRPVVSKSRSVGSPRLSSTESRVRRLSTPFRESIPNVFDTEYESTKVPSINDIITRRSSAKVTATAAGGVAAMDSGAAGIWVPSDSIARSSNIVGDNLHSPSAVLTSSQPVATKNISSGQIFVTPAASINFVASLSQQKSTLSTQDIKTETEVETPSAETTEAE